MVNITEQMNEFNLEGRYPLNYVPSPEKSEAETLTERSKEVYQWLIRQL